MAYDPVIDDEFSCFISPDEKKKMIKSQKRQKNRHLFDNQEELYYDEDVRIYRQEKLNRQKINGTFDPGTLETEQRHLDSIKAFHELMLGDGPKRLPASVFEYEKEVSWLLCKAELTGAQS